MEHESALHEIATLAAAIRSGYPEAANNWQQSRQLLAGLRQDVSEQDRSGFIVPDEHLQTAQHGERVTRDLCNEYRQELSRLANLAFGHLPDAAVALPSLERVSREWHKLPLPEWSPLLDALHVLDVRALAAIQEIERTRDLRAAELVSQLGVREPAYFAPAVTVESLQAITTVNDGDNSKGHYTTIDRNIQWLADYEELGGSIAEFARIKRVRRDTMSKAIKSAKIERAKRGRESVNRRPQKK